MVTYDPNSITPAQRRARTVLLAIHDYRIRQGIRVTATSRGRSPKLSDRRNARERIARPG
jgi:hypothetical protein